MPARVEIGPLQSPAGEPVVVLQRQTLTSEGRIVEFARGVHTAARFSWSYTFKNPVRGAHARGDVARRLPRRCGNPLGLPRHAPHHPAYRRRHRTRQP
ncbi:hypothetical protein [Actinomadura terrae]|uniref:hypothetical protein n=1 Tax=Actinomadura terrae TaxID=604353 RepID=UPI0035576CAD